LVLSVSLCTFSCRFMRAALLATTKMADDVSHDDELFLIGVGRSSTGAAP
jgi:hypothetical protein